MYISSEDLLIGLSTLALWLAIAGVVVAFSIWRARRHGSRTLALDVTRNASLVYLCLTAVGLVLSGFQILARPTLLLSDAVFSRVQDQQDFLMSSPCPDDAAPEALLCGAEVTPIPLGPRLLVYIGTVLSILASGAVAWAIYNATRRAGERQPFHPSVSRTFGIMAIVVMLAAVLGDLLLQIGMTLAARSLEWGPGSFPISFGLNVAFWPFAVAVGMFALSAIFRHGAQLQRETEGLV